MATHAECAKRWAEQKSKRLTAGNLSFKGDTIFSYWTPIGRLVPANDGPVALINDQKYSSSTSAHQNIIFGAAKNLYPIFRTASADPKDHSRNQKWYVDLILVFRAQVKSARKETTRAYYAKSIERVTEELRRYEVAFSLEPLKLPPMDSPVDPKPC